MSLFIQQLQRELLVQSRQKRVLLNSCLFFLMILFFFPLTMKPDPLLMKTIASGLIWMSLLLSLLLSAERLFLLDYEHGVIEQWLACGLPLHSIISAKIIAHWLFNMIPILLLCPLIALVFSFNVTELWVLIISLLCGSPALFSLCTLAASFGLGVSQKGGVMALILLPLTVPILIFGSGIINLAIQDLPVSGHCALLLAFSILSVGLLPFAVTGILRINTGE